MSNWCQNQHDLTWAWFEFIILNYALLTPGRAPRPEPWSQRSTHCREGVDVLTEAGLAGVFTPVKDPLQHPWSIYEQASPSSTLYSAHSCSSSPILFLLLPFFPHLLRLAHSLCNKHTQQRLIDFSPSSLCVFASLLCVFECPSSTAQAERMSLFWALFGLQVNVCAARRDTCTQIDGKSLLTLVFSIFPSLVQGCLSVNKKHTRRHHLK